MADMTTDRMLKLGRLVGLLFILCWSVWTLFHLHKPANRETDLFVALAFIGFLIFLWVEFKYRSRISK